MRFHALDLFYQQETNKQTNKGIEMTIELITSHNSRTLRINGRKIFSVKAKTGLTIYADRITTLKIFRTRGCI